MMQVKRLFVRRNMCLCYHGGFVMFMAVFMMMRLKRMWKQKGEKIE